MKRYILTGAPGCGKTSIIRTLEMQGYGVTEESATDIIEYDQKILGISEPWHDRKFIEDIVKLQKHRQKQIEKNDLGIHFFDRSPICTYALAVYLGFEIPSILLDEIDYIIKNNIYQKQVFFIENLGRIEPTDARKISFDEALVFEKGHVDAYQEFGYDCIFISKAPVIDRVQRVLKLIV